MDFESGKQSQPCYRMWVIHCGLLCILCVHHPPALAVSDHPANTSPAFDLSEALREKTHHMTLAWQSLVCLMSDQAVSVLCPVSGVGPVAGTVPLLCL